MLLETTATAERTSGSVRAMGVLQSRKTMIIFGHRGVSGRMELINGLVMLLVLGPWLTG